jgi:SNF2 family DNA or RNA helicase
VAAGAPNLRTARTALCTGLILNHRPPLDPSLVPQVDWQYIIIDEAQRMKDRQSKLARDLDRFNGGLGWVAGQQLVAG